MVMTINIEALIFYEDATPTFVVLSLSYVQSYNIKLIFAFSIIHITLLLLKLVRFNLL